METLRSQIAAKSQAGKTVFWALWEKSAARPTYTVLQVTSKHNRPTIAEMITVGVPGSPKLHTNKQHAAMAKQAPWTLVLPRDCAKRAAVYPKMSAKLRNLVLSSVDLLKP